MHRRSSVWCCLLPNCTVICAVSSEACRRLVDRCKYCNNRRDFSVCRDQFRGMEFACVCGGNDFADHLLWYTQEARERENLSVTALQLCESCGDGFDSSARCCSSPDHVLLLTSATRLVNEEEYYVLVVFSDSVPFLRFDCQRNFVVDSSITYTLYVD